MSAAESVELIAPRLLASRLEQVLEPKFDSREFRLSESGGCPRKRVARALGLLHEDFEREDAAVFERGNVVERWVVEQFKRAYPRKCRTQVHVRTKWGTGHIDLWFPEQRKIVEVKSVKSAAKPFLPKEEHLLQVQSYLHFFQKATHAELVYVLVGPGILPGPVFPVFPDPRTGAEIEKELERLASYRDAGELPPVPDKYAPDRFPCYWRSDEREVRCPLWEQCWSTAAERAQESVLSGNEDDAHLLELWIQARDREREATREADRWAQTRFEIEEAISRRLDLYHADALSVGDLTLRRTRVAGRTTYDVQAALRAGAVSEAALAPFRRTLAGYTRWSLSKNKGDAQ